MKVAYIYLILLIVPLIFFIKLFIWAKKLSEKTNEKDMSGFEIANNILRKSNTYIIERRDYLINNYEDARDTLKFSTKVFHESSIFYSVIACFYAISVSNKNICKGNLLKVLDIANILSVLFFLIGVIAYSIDFIYVAVAIIIVSLSIYVFNLNNSSIIADKTIDYLIDKNIISANYENLKRVIKYVFITRIITSNIDFVYKGIRKIRS